MKTKHTGSLIEGSLIFTDTRNPVRGGLFVALKGESHDANLFVMDAIKGGASGVVCHANGARLAAGQEVEILEVPDTLVALRNLASEWRSQFTLPVISVVGNVGKTTSKEFLATLLSATLGPCLKTEGSENGWVGIALTLLKLKSEHRAAVVEIGIDEPNSMRDHVDRVKPEALLVSSLGPEHLEKLISVEQAVAEELIAADLVHASGGELALPIDSPFILRQAERWPRAVFFSLGRTETPRGSACVRGSLEGKVLVVSFPNGRTERLELPVASEAMASNALGAITVCWLALGRPDRLWAKAPRLTLPGGRSETAEYERTYWILDHYNSNPSSLGAALGLLESLSREPGHSGVKAAFLGDMRELGTDSRGLHAAFAKQIYTLSIERLFLAGPEMAALYEELQRLRYPGQLVYAKAPADLIPYLGSLSPRDTVLLKGSRGMRMEVLWHAFSKTTPAPSH